MGCTIFIWLGEISDYFMGDSFYCLTFRTIFQSIECVFLPFDCLEGAAFLLSGSRVQ